MTIRPWHLLVAFLLIATLATLKSCEASRANAHLAEVKRQADSGAVDAAQTRKVAAMLRDAAREDSVRLQGALARNDTLGRRLTIALGHVSPPILSQAPDTCTPWVLRGQELETALGVAREQIANIPAVVSAAEDRARHLQAASDTLDKGLGRAEARFDTIRVVVPTKLPTTTVSLYGGARYAIAQGWPHAEAGVQWKALFAGVDAQPVGGAVQLRGVLGFRETIRLW